MKRNLIKSKKDRTIVGKKFKISTYNIRNIAVVSVIVLAIASTVSFYTRNEQRIANLNKVEIFENTERLAHDWDAFLTTRNEIIKDLSSYYSTFLTSPDEIRENMFKQIAKNSCFDYIEYVDSDGFDHTVTGELTNAKDRLYYRNGIKGVNGVQSVFNSRATHETMLMVYTPVYYKNDVIGVLIGEITTKGRIAELLDISHYSNKSEIYLCDTEGNIFSQSKLSNYIDVNNKVNAITFFKEETFENRVKENINSGKNSSFVSRGKNGCIGCVIRAPKSEWCIISVYPQKAHKAVVRESSNLAYQLIIIAVILSVILAFVLIYTFHIDHKYRIEKEKKQKNQLANHLKTISDQFAVVHALSTDMFDIYVLDLDNDTSKVLKTGGKFKSSNEQVIHPYTKTWENFANNFIVEEDRAKAIKLCSIENICKQLSDKNEYSFTIRINISGKIHHNIIKFTHMPQGKNKFLMGICNIDAQVRKEVEQNKKLKEALDAATIANRAKTDFLNNMSHDIRTPMNAIVGFSELAVKHIDDKERVNDYLNKIQVSSDHLLNLINDILDMSRIESGKTTLEEQETNLNELLNDINTIVLSDIAKKHLTFTIEKNNLVNENVICDKLRLSQILINLLSNAMKFTKPYGSVSLNLSQSASKTAGYADFSFTVKDTGIGMSKEFQKKVFEPFERERTSTESGIQGTGLGMSICKKIVDMMGGAITVESEIGAGTIFTVNLSFKISENQEKKISKADSLSDYSVEGKSVLLVEDNPLNQEIAEELLTEIKFNVTVASNGLEAVEILKNATVNQFDFILMDVQMPKMNGYDATKAIRSLNNPLIADIPIIAMTANAFDEDKKKALEAGMNGHIAKPIEANVMINTIKSILKEKESNNTSAN